MIQLKRRNVRFWHKADMAIARNEADGKGRV